MNNLAITLVEELVGTEPILFHNSSASESTSDDEPCNCRIKIRKIENFVEETVKNYDDVTFQHHFRMSRHVAYKLIDQLTARNAMNFQANGEEMISTEKAFLLTLWYVANTETFRQISDRFNVSLSSAHRTFVKVIDFILTLGKDEIKWPTQNEADIISKEFSKKQGIKNVLGAIDGCHIRIPKPKNNQDSYCNRKGYHSLLLQGIVDHKKMFINVYCGEPGSMHDARLLRKSQIYAKVQDPVFMYNKFLLGDSAYPCNDWMITLFKDNGALSENQKLFNYKHSSTRIIVENAFGLLKGRFRRLMHLSNLSMNLSSKCIMACCILHNICIREKDRTVIAVPDLSDDLHHVPDVYTTGSNTRRMQILRELFE